MPRRSKTVALLSGLAAAIGIVTAASAAELKPLEGYAIPLGDRAAAVYFRQHDRHKELVITLARVDLQGERTRQVVTLEPRETATIPLTPSGVLILEVTDRDGSVVIDVRPDLSAGARLARAETD